jgi:hypothetical protein
MESIPTDDEPICKRIRALEKLAGALFKLDPKDYDLLWVTKKSIHKVLNRLVAVRKELRVLSK